MNAIAVRIRTEGITGKQVFIELYGVKGGITEESFRAGQRMCTEKILKGGDQKPCVVDRFIFIRRSGFIRVVIIVKVMCFCRIDFLADGFGKVNKLMENKLDIIEEIQLKASDLRSVWNFVKPTELTKVPGIVKEYQKQGVCRD